MKKPVDAEERAVFIFSQIVAYGKMGSGIGRRKVKEFIRDEIQKAMDHAREEVLNEQKCKDCECSYERCCCNPVRETESYEKGATDMRKKAADLAAEVCPDENYGEDCHESIAKRIRELSLSPDQRE